MHEVCCLPFYMSSALYRCCGSRLVPLPFPRAEFAKNHDFIAPTAKHSRTDGAKHYLSSDRLLLLVLSGAIENHACALSDAALTLAAHACTGSGCEASCQPVLS